jgi:hypothetical protein
MGAANEVNQSQTWGQLKQDGLTLVGLWASLGEIGAVSQLLGLITDQQVKLASFASVDSSGKILDGEASGTGGD